MRYLNLDSLLEDVDLSKVPSEVADQVIDLLAAREPLAGEYGQVSFKDLPNKLVQWLVNNE